ncbi:class I SAM-dependent methyltransferase [Paenibacillus antri]|uniref:Class I SAM-dependent methyltransferase n=1 Tax=Paenibacillus antri TaxID=2582848 RepID=A0A5R9GAW3_9BACL|nr:class I SAM-dependent methyltransferase [Paenibacillus antri]TLS52209.1 class I SAM-dependent methyltransferase [Paenibacillus antri]
MNRIERIRSMEKQYHDACYENNKLFQEGSWLHKPVKTVLDLFSLFDQKEEVQILDLGCGVGRNSIPIAEKLKHRSGKVVCVDLLESAVSILGKYANQYGVEEWIDRTQIDIGNFPIGFERYDYIFSVSSLEHLDSEATFDKVITNMIQGTKVGGVNCIIISTNVTETLIDSGTNVEPMYELNFETQYLIDKFQDAYRGWETLKQTTRPYDVEIEREGKRVLLHGDVVTWAVQKVGNCV